MQSYSYDGTTGEYLGASAAAESPLEPGVYLIPANATGTVPPQAEPGHAVCWQGGAWTQVEDHRGQTCWASDGSPVAIAALGPLPEGLSATQPASRARTVADCAAQKITQANAWMGNNLSPTDYTVIKAVDPTSGATIPQAALERRAGVRQAGAAAKAAVAAIQAGAAGEDDAAAMDAIAAVNV